MSPSIMRMNKFLREHKAITIPDLRVEAQVSYTNASTYLDRLYRKGLLTKSGRDHRGRVIWIKTEAFYMRNDR